MKIKYITSPGRKTIMTWIVVDYFSERFSLSTPAQGFLFDFSNFMC